MVPSPWIRRHCQTGDVHEQGNGIRTAQGIRRRPVGRAAQAAVVGAGRTRCHHGAHSLSVHLGALAERHRQRLLRSSGQERGAGLEGLPIRFPRPRQLHHRRQDPRRLLGAGVVRPGVRLLQLEHPTASGPGRRGLGAHPLPISTTLAGRGTRTRRRPAVRADACGVGDVPIQQPRRVFDPASASGCLGVLVGPGEGVRLAAGGGWCLGRSRLSHQDVGGVHRTTRVCPGLSVVRKASLLAPALAPLRVLGRHSGRRWLVGRPCGTLAGCIAPLHRGEHEQLGGGPHSQPHRGIYRRRRPRNSRIW
jgi:hypothetical protein